MIAQTLATELGIERRFVEATLKLLDEGNTVPFIARYRKEVTGGLDDAQLRMLADRAEYLRGLNARKETVLAAIEKAGKLTPELRAEIAAATTKVAVEDIYRPFKQRRTTKAAMARAAGLEKLAEELIDNPAQDPETLAEGYVCEGYADTAAALAGARAIIVDDCANNPQLVGSIRSEVYETSVLRSEAAPNATHDGKTYSDYFAFEEKLEHIPSHRALALCRGEREGVLKLTVDAGDDAYYEDMIARAMDYPIADSAWLRSAVHYAWRSKLQVSAALDARTTVIEKAEAVALGVFADNLKDVLLGAPAGERATLGLDPGYRNGVKTAVVSRTGAVLATAIVYPHQPQKRWDEALSTLVAMCVDHKVELIAIGNGTASRETEQLARECAKKVKELAARGSDAHRPAPIPVVVSEAGASVYSASQLASEELPDLDVSLRGAVSIARRLQDPLAELVKIDPKSIGVGQYQHDVNQTALARTLDGVVENAVNSVGVDVNTASEALLAHVAGVSASVARNIVSYRTEHGSFVTRKDLLRVPRLGEQTFKQAAGFLRIRGGDEPLDASAVHPETYDVARRIVASSGVDVAALPSSPQALKRLSPKDFVSDQWGLPTIRDIFAELEKPGRDPRPSFTTARFDESISSVADLRPGMVLEGTVTNVVQFGAFVDIGVHRDGLVHIAAMSRSFVSDPRDVVKTGEVVKVKVVDVDTERQRISLSLRLDDDADSSTSASHGTSRSSGRGSGGAGERGSNRHASSERGSQAHGASRHDRRGGQRERRDHNAKTRRQQPGGSMAEALRAAGYH